MKRFNHTVPLCVTLAMAMPMPALAQVAANAPAADAGEPAIQEILVTAQRREERARDVPISITQINGAELQARGITNTRDLSVLTPGLRIDRVGSNTQPTMRGISTAFTAPGNDSPVPIYIDGIYQQSLAGLSIELPDIRAVDVLKGPQGTLFGRNATGGAIQISTLDPEFTFSGNGLASYGRFEDVQLNAFVTGPLSDVLAVSLSGALHDNDGYLHDIVRGGSAGGLKARLVRGKLLFQPSDDFKIRLSGYYSIRNDGQSSSQPLNGNTQASTQPGVIIPTRPYDISGLPNSTDVESYGTSLYVEKSFSAGTLSGLFGYTKWNVHSLTDSDRVEIPGKIGSITDNTFAEQGVSQELNFASEKFGSFSFVAGLFHYTGYGKPQALSIRQDFPTVSNTDLYSKQSSDASAVFAEVTFDVTDRLSLIVGGRYSTEKRKIKGLTVAAGVAPPPLPKLGKRRDSGFTPRFSAKYELTPETNVYFTYSRGFKSGAFNTTTLSLPLQSVAPEKVTAYEIGSKSNFGRFNLNLAAFYYDYTDIQVNALVFVNNQSQARIENAASARIYGLDAEAGWAVTNRLSLSGGLSLLSAKYNDFPAATVNVPRPNNAGNTTVFIDAGGNYLGRSPRYTMNLRGEYKIPLAVGELKLSSSIYHTAHFYYEPSNRIVQPSYTLIDARATWKVGDSGLSLAVFGNNLANKLIYANVSISGLADAVLYAPPRTYGISAAYKF